MAIEIQIEAQDAYSNLQEIIDNIKALKQAARDAKTEEEFERITRELGRARKALKDFNDDVKTNAAGSVFEKMNRQTRELGDNIRNLNFADAGGDLNNLATSFSNINFKTISAGLKDVTKGFLNLGRAILSNPYTYLAIAIAAVVAALVGFANRMGLITPIIKFFSDAIDVLIQNLKDLGDYFRFTSFAIDEAAKKNQKASKLVVEAVNKQIVAYTDSQTAAVKTAETNLAIAKIQKKSAEDIFELEKTLLQKKKDLNEKISGGITTALKSEAAARENNLTFLVTDAAARVRIVGALKEEKKIIDALIAKRDASGIADDPNEDPTVVALQKQLDALIKERQQKQYNINNVPPKNAAEENLKKAFEIRVKNIQKEIEDKNSEIILAKQKVVEETNKLTKQQDDLLRRIEQAETVPLTDISALLEMNQEVAKEALKGLGITDEQIDMTLQYIKTYQDLNKLKKDSTSEQKDLENDLLIAEAQKNQTIEERAKEAAAKRLEIIETLSKETISIETQTSEKIAKFADDTAKHEELLANQKIENFIKAGKLELNEARNLVKALNELREKGNKKEEELISNKYDLEIAENERVQKVLEAQREELVDANGKVKIEENKAVVDALDKQISARKNYSNTLKDQKTLELKIAKDTATAQAEEEKQTTLAALDEVIKTREEKLEDERDKKLAAMQIALANEVITEEQYNKYRAKINAETELAIQSERKRAAQNFEQTLTAQLATESNILKRSLRQATIDIRTKIQTDLKNRTDAIDKELKELEDKNLKESDLYKQLQDEKIQIAKNAANTIGSIEAEAQARQNAMLQDAYDTAVNFNDALAGFAEARQEKELYGFEQARDAELQAFDERLQAQVTAAGDNEQEINRIKEAGADAREQIERRLAVEEDAIKKRAFENNKQFAIAQAVIAGAQGVVAAFASLPSEPTGAEIIAKSIFAASIAATTIAQVAKIRATQYRGGGYTAPNIKSPLASGGGGGGGGGVQPNFSFFGNNNQGNELGATGGRQGAPGTNITVDVNISESEITSTQQRVARLTSAAEL